MRILIAPDSYKDALRAEAAARYIADGVRQAVPQAHCDLCPVSDGGEGFVDAMVVGVQSAQRVKVATTDPLGRPTQTAYALAPADEGRACTAVIELAAASGLECLTPEERNPQKTTTYGTGTLIQHAIEKGATDILLGIGGSATTDAATGIVQALGGVFLDPHGSPLSQPITGGDLGRIARLDLAPLHARIGGRTFRIACDVTNPLHGRQGAAYVYGPQKGATPEQVAQLDAGLRHLAQVWQDQLGVDVQGLAGAGAAGGVGGGMVAMLGAALCPGAELVLDAVGFDRRLGEADLVLTGEGRLDSQSLQGKAAMTVAARAKRAGVPCVALVGCIGDGAQTALNHGLTGYRVIGEGLAPEESIARTAELLKMAAAKVVATYTP